MKIPTGFKIEDYDLPDDPEFYPGKTPEEIAEIRKKEWDELPQTARDYFNANESYIAQKDYLRHEECEGQVTLKGDVVTCLKCNGQAWENVVFKNGYVSNLIYNPKFSADSFRLEKHKWGKIFHECGVELVLNTDVVDCAKCPECKVLGFRIKYKYNVATFENFLYEHEIEQAKVKP